MTENFAELGEIWPILGVVHEQCFFNDDVESEEEKGAAQKSSWLSCDTAIDDTFSRFPSHCVSAELALRHRRSALSFVPKSMAFAVFGDACALLFHSTLPFERVRCFVIYVIRVDAVPSGLYLLFPKNALDCQRTFAEFAPSTETLALSETVTLFRVKALSERARRR